MMDIALTMLALISAGLTLEAFASGFSLLAYAQPASPRSVMELEFGEEAGNPS